MAVVGRHAAKGWAPELARRNTVLVRQISRVVRDIWRTNTVLRRASSGVGVVTAICCVPYHHDGINATYASDALPSPASTAM